MIGRTAANRQPCRIVDRVRIFTIESYSISPPR